MKEISNVVGWVSAYLSPYKTVEYTEDRKRALVDRIRKRKYNFPHSAHQFLDYAAPFYSDNVLCVLTKQEWDEAMGEAYKDEPFGPRLMPQDVIDLAPIGDVLYEKKKFINSNKEC